MGQPTAAFVRLFPPLSPIAVLAVLAASSSLASAQDVDGLYQDLQADFLAVPSLLTVSAASNTNHSSFGQVQRLISPVGVADFGPGFTASIDPSDFSTTLFVTGITPTSATATGAFTATDSDGDTITASVSGAIAIAAGSSTFTGILSGILFSDNGAQDGLFDGSTSGSFSLSGFSALATGTCTVFAGNIDVSLGFNQSNFVIEPSYAAFEISEVPAPSAAAVFMALGAVSLRRRRR